MENINKEYDVGIFLNYGKNYETIKTMANINFVMQMNLPMKSRLPKP